MLITQIIILTACKSRFQRTQ